MFVAPGLTRRERRLLFGFLPLLLLAFVSGMAFGYFVLTPPLFTSCLTSAKTWYPPNPREQYRQFDGAAAVLDGRRLRDPADNVSAGPARYRVVAESVALPASLGGPCLRSGRADHAHLRPREPDLGRLPLLALYEFGVLLALLQSVTAARPRPPSPSSSQVKQSFHPYNEKNRPVAGSFRVFLVFCAHSNMESAHRRLGYGRVLLVLVVLAQQGRLESADSFPIELPISGIRRHPKTSRIRASRGKYLK